VRAARKKRENAALIAGGSFSTRQGRILILLLTSGALAMIAAAWWYYARQRAEMEGAAARELATVSDVESLQIVNWRRERIGDGRVLMSSPITRIASRALSSRAPAEADRADLLDDMSRLAGEFLYTDIALVDLDGKVRIRLNPDETDASELRKHARGDLARQAMSAGDVVLSDISLDTRDGRPLMSLTVPVRGSGAFILEIDPSRFLYPYLASWPGPGRTAETLLVRREGDDLVYLSKMRHAPGTALFFRRPLRHLTPPPDAVSEAGSAAKGVDYRGVPVLSEVRRIPDSPWFLVAKIDAAEVDEPVRRLGWEMALIAALIGLAGTAGVGLIWRGQQARIHLEREAWFYTVANDTPAYLWMASPGEENSFINTPLGRFLGTDQQRLPKHWPEYLHPDDRARAHATFLESLSARRKYVDEFRILRFDGEYRWVVDEAVPRFSPTGEFLGYAGSLLDITDRRQAEEQLRIANASLAGELSERTRKEQEIQGLTARLIGAQEEERKRLARELHDDFNQQIAALSIAMGNLKRHIPEERADTRGQSDRIHQKLVHLAESIRRMSHELHPAVLEYSGLAAALQAYCNEFGELTGVRVSLQIDGSFDGVPSLTALCIYRITQEALQNVSKHAKVGSASVELSRSNGALRLTVSDTGVGMEPDRAEAAAGLGLVSIKERTRLVKGSLEIISRPDQGTTITVRIPE